MSSLRRGHANLLCIVPILVYVGPKPLHWNITNRTFINWIAGFQYSRTNYGAWREGELFQKVFKSIDQIDAKLFLVFSLRAITISRRGISRVFFISSSISSGLSSERIILSPFTKEFRGEGHSYESLNFSGATFVAIITNHSCKLQAHGGTIL